MMKIMREAYDKILQFLPECPPETGGILGGRNGIVYEICHDLGKKGNKSCSYTPDTGRLNRQIEIWRKSGMEFFGIFHCHFYGVSTLSEGDEIYIEKIMKAMPDKKEQLYFPVAVLPDRRIVVYKATRSKNAVIVAEDSIELK